MKKIFLPIIATAALGMGLHAYAWQGGDEGEHRAKPMHHKEEQGGEVECHPYPQKPFRECEQHGRSSGQAKAGWGPGRPGLLPRLHGVGPRPGRGGNREGRVLANAGLAESRAACMLAISRTRRTPRQSATGCPTG